MTEEEMIIAIKGGGRQQEIALQALYRKSAEFRRHYIYKGMSHQTADDLVQETIVKIFRNATAFTGGGGFGDASANAWMWTIAKNVMYSHVRVVKVDEVSIDDDSVGDAARMDVEADLARKNPHATVGQTAQDCVTDGIYDFSADYPDRAKALEMQLDGEDIASIAQRIGRSVTATKEYLSQCKKKLTPYIEHCTALLQP